MLQYEMRATPKFTQVASAQLQFGIRYTQQYATLLYDVTTTMTLKRSWQYQGTVHGEKCCKQHPHSTMTICLAS